MVKNKPRILIISSASPIKGPGTGALKTYNIFKNSGFDIDLLTKYKVHKHPEILSVYDRFEEEKSIIIRINSFIRRLYNKLFFKQKKGYHFFYKKEVNPPIPTSSVLDKINKQYDIVHIYFWQEMLSFQTVKAIHDKLHCMFYLACADYSIMSGGCHFTGDCKKFISGCGACPAIYSKRNNDFTSFNVNYRHNFFKEVKPFISANNYMISEFFSKSYLLKDYHRIISPHPILQLDVFKPTDSTLLRENYNIPTNKSFICLFGCQNLNDERKGVTYLLEALNIFYSKLPQDERDKVLLLLVGNNIDEIKDKLLFDYKHLDYVSIDKLPSIYSMSNLFLSPSVNDAGPSMLIQSLACGTPVVAFEMGYALDFVKDKNTGYCAQLKNANDFAFGISKIYNMNDIDYKIMRKRCRKLMEQTSSHDAYINFYCNVYEEYKSQL